MAPSATPTPTAVDISATTSAAVSSGPFGAKSAIFNTKGTDSKSMAIGAVKKNGKSAVPTIPDFSTKEEEQRYSKEHLACAFRVFAANGFDEGASGHMSLRDPINTDSFWINP
jgi:hypothetical protein